MKNRKNILLGLMAVTLFSLTSCGGGNEDSKPISSITTDSQGNLVFNNVKLKVWSIIGDPDNKYLEKVSKAFNDYYAENGVQAEITSIVNGDYYTQLANVINTDPESAPDVVIFHSERLTKLAKEKILVPMDSYLSLLKDQFNQEDYLSNVMKECVYDNKTYGIPLDVHAGVWFVRSDILEKNGLTKPTNLEEFKNVCNTLVDLNSKGRLWTRAMNKENAIATEWVQKKLDDFFPVVMSDTGGIENGWIPQTAVFQNGGEIVGENGRPAWNTTGLETTMKMFRDWQSGTGYNGAFVGPNQSAETVWTNLASGHAVFSMEGPWWVESRLDEYEEVLGSLEDSEGKTYAPLDIMNISRMYAQDQSKDYATKIYGVGHCFSITKTCAEGEKRVAASLFAKYMTEHSEDYMAGGHLPANKTVLNSPKYLNSASYKRYLKEFGDPSQFEMLGGTPYYSEVYEKLKSVYVDIFSANKKNMTPKEIIDTRYKEALDAIAALEDL